MATENIAKEEQLKKEIIVQAQQHKQGIDNYLQINIGYGIKLVFPYDDGMAFMKTLKKAEEVNGHSSDKTITPIDTTIESRIISQAEYLAGKMGHLLGAPVNKEIFEKENI